MLLLENAVAGRGGDEPELFVYRVKSGEAATLAELLNKLVGGTADSVGQPPSARLAPGERAGDRNVTVEQLIAKAQRVFRPYTFEVKDVNAYKSLQVRANVYKQRSLNFYLIGELVAKVNNVPRGGGIDFQLPPYALKILKNGRNTLAVSAEHGKRNVYFTLRLEALLKK